MQNIRVCENIEMGFAYQGVGDYCGLVPDIT